MRLYLVRPGGARQGPVGLPHLVLSTVPFEIIVIMLSLVLNLYLALSIGGNFGPSGKLCRGCAGARCFRSSPTSPPLPVGSNANCPG